MNFNKNYLKKPFVMHVIWEFSCKLPILLPPRNEDCTVFKIATSHLKFRQLPIDSVANLKQNLNNVSDC